jgi:peptidyl-prolyl cis-trans isomerase SurA
MRKLVLTCLAAGLYVSSGFAQTLFTYGTNPVSKDEFLRVYTKNTISKKPDLSEKALREYLDLYSLFRMKVREAELQRLDTMENIQYELNNYRKQLAKNYLTDEAVTNQLIRDAYNRMKEEVRVAHILIAVPMMAGGPDTVAAYKKADSIYNALTKNKADFAALAGQFSEDKGTKETGGEIGYISALQAIFPFENAAYNTPVGKVSAPFRTQFGYHIVKVLDRRPAKGELKVAQILVTAPKSKGDEGLAEARKRVEQIQNELKNGASFESLVTKYSEDKFSKDQNGVLPVFGVGRMTPAFENAAFALKKPGDVSAAVQTDYGFHIIKLVERYPLKPYDSLYTQLKRKVENDSRAGMARESFFSKIKHQNGFKENPANYDVLFKRIAAIPDTGKDANTFVASDYKSMNAPLFSLAGKDYRQNDFMQFAEKITRGRLMGARNATMRDLYNMYVQNVVNDFEEHRLVEEHPDFKNLMTEYRDGIMLFELMDRNVWGKASKDTVGLKAFYETRKDKYKWEPGFTGAVYRFKDEKSMKEGMKLITAKSVKEEDVIKKLNTDSNPDVVTVQRGHFEFSKFTDASRTELAKAKPTTEPKKNEDGSYTVVRVNEVFNEPTTKSLEDAKGYVVAEYQDYLEQQWNQQMRQKYPIKVNEDVLNAMIQK